MSIAQELRELITEFYLHGQPLGRKLEELVPRVEALEHATSPVSDTPGQGRPWEPDPDQTP